MQKDRKVLVIEDNPDIASLVRLHLEDLDCEVKVSSSGTNGFHKAETGAFDLIVLDLMLPGTDGLEVCRKLRARTIYTPILMLTAKSSNIDRVVGLEMGADDYLTKPFDIHEFLARVKAIFRRSEVFSDPPAAGPKNISRGDLALDLEKRTVRIADRAIDLTSKEFDLLTHFADKPGRVYTRQQLMDQVWGLGYEGYEHTVNSHINRLRTKIENGSADYKYIQTVWGVGYRFNDDL